MNLIKKHNKLFHALIILLTVAVNLAFFTGFSRANSQLSFVRQWGTGGTTSTATSLQVTLSPNGQVFVSEAESHTVSIYDSTGHPIRVFGVHGTGNGEFDFPWGLAASASSNIYVADTNNHRIQYFTQNGIYLGQFGTYGTGKGELQFPRGIAIASDGSVFVADSLNHRIERFSPTGVYMGQFGSQGSNPNQFEFPEDVFVSNTNEVFVTDSSNHVVKVFTLDGTFIRQFGTQGSGDGQFNFPKGITVTATGAVFVADTGNYRIQNFLTSGTFQSKFGGQGSGNSQFSAAQDVALGAGGVVYVADGGNRRIQLFSQNGVFSKSFPITNPTTDSSGKFNFPSGIFKVPSGNIYVADKLNSRIQVFTPTGEFVSKFGSFGQGDGEFSSPVDVAVAPDDRIYVSDQDNDRIQIFSANGTYLSQFGDSGSGPGQFDHPGGIVVNNGYLYVADTGNNRIQKFDIDGNYNSEIGSYGNGDTEFAHPADLDVDALGNIYIADTLNNRIQVLDQYFNFVEQFAISVRNPDPADPVNGSYFGPRGLVVQGSHIYISDTENNRVQVIDTDGNFIAKIGVEGTSASEFSTPIGITTGATNQIFVVDSNNHRVQEFQLDQVPPVVPVDPIDPVNPGGGGGGGGVIVVPVLPVSPVVPVIPVTEVDPVIPPVLPNEDTLLTILPEPVQEIIESVTTVITESVLVPARVVVAKVEAVTPSPLKTYIPQTIMTSGLLVGSIAMITDNLFSTPMTFAQFLLIPARMWANLLALFGIKKRRRPWGAVYDTMTKQPLDPVYLELINKDGFAVAKTTTDIYGRYSFKVTPGHYMLRPRKAGYVFPSLVLAHAERDEVYKDLYFGNYFEINHEAETIDKNVPMDRAKIDWKEFMKQDQKMLTFLAHRDELIAKTSHLLFIAGFIIAVGALLLAPRAYTIIVFLLYLMMYIARRLGPNPSKIGKVTDATTKAPLSFAIVRVFSVKLGNEVVRKATNKFGQFFCPVPDGDYYLSFDRKNENGSYTEANKKELIHIDRGVVAGKWEASF